MRAVRAVAVAALVGLAATMAAPAGNNADAGWIAFDERFYYEGGDSWEIFVIRPNGTRRRMVTPTSLLGDKAEAEWSPDGTMIVFRLVERGLYIINVDGTGLRQLTAGAGDSGPAWSPDGSRIAFYRRNAIWTMRTDGTRRRRLVRASGGTMSYLHGGPAWAPDGRRLVFERGLDLWAVNADGSRFARIAVAFAQTGPHVDEGFFSRTRGATDRVGSPSSTATEGGGGSFRTGAIAPRGHRTPSELRSTSTVST